MHRDYSQSGRCGPALIGSPRCPGNDTFHNQESSALDGSAQRRMVEANFACAWACEGRNGETSSARLRRPVCSLLQIPRVLPCAGAGWRAGKILHHFLLNHPHALALHNDNMFKAYHRFIAQDTWRRGMFEDSTIELGWRNVVTPDVFVLDALIIEAVHLAVKAGESDVTRGHLGAYPQSTR